MRVLIISCLLIQYYNILSFTVHEFNKKIIDGASASGTEPRYNGEYLLLEKIIRKDDIVFDVGANQGNYTSFVLSLNRGNKIFAFEPVTAIYNEMVNKFQNNSQVEMYNKGLYSHSEPGMVIYNNGELSSVYDRTATCDEDTFNNKDVQPITVITLDEFCLERGINNIDFLKIDTEGAEYNVLSGGLNMLAENKILNIQFEYGGCYLDAGCHLKQVFHLLQNYGYFLYKITPDGLVMLPKWEDFFEDYRYCNYFASLKKIN